MIGPLHHFVHASRFVPFKWKLTFTSNTNQELGKHKHMDTHLYEVHLTMWKKYLVTASTETALTTGPDSLSRCECVQVGRTQARGVKRGIVSVTVVVTERHVSKAT